MKVVAFIAAPRFRRGAMSDFANTKFGFFKPTVIIMDWAGLKIAVK